LTQLQTKLSWLIFMAHSVQYHSLKMRLELVTEIILVIVIVIVNYPTLLYLFHCGTSAEITRASAFLLPFAAVKGLTCVLYCEVSKSTARR